MKEITKIDDRTIRQEVEKTQSEAFIRTKPMPGPIYRPRTGRRKFAPRELATLNPINMPEINVLDLASNVKIYTHCAEQLLQHSSIIEALSNDPSHWYLIGSWVQKATDDCPSQLHLQYMPINKPELSASVEAAIKSIQHQVTEHRDSRSSQNFNALKSQYHGPDSYPSLAHVAQHFDDLSTKLYEDYGREVIIEGDFTLWIKWGSTADHVKFYDNIINYVTTGQGRTRAYDSVTEELRIY